MEALESPAIVITLPQTASAQLTKSRFVSAAGAHTAAGVRAVGVSFDNYAVDELAAVITAGVALVEAGGTVAVGDEVQSDAQGRAITLASGKSNGIALSAATTGQFTAVRLF